MAYGQWGAGNLPKGQPKATWYDEYGRSFVLPVDLLHSKVHYQERGLRLTPPESPLPVPDSEFGRYALANDSAARVPAPMSATRQLSEAPAEQPNVEMLLARIEQLEATRKRGPDKKKRKKRKRNRA